MPSRAANPGRKDEDMAKRRMRFGTWCNKDINDSTKIVYEFKTAEGKTLYFTSEDKQSFSMLARLRYAWIESIEYVSNEFSTHWYAKLYED